MTISVCMTLVLLLCHGGEDRSRRLHELASSETRTVASVSAVEAWAQALLAHNIQRLAAYQFEEARPWIRQQLEDPDSTLSRILFGRQDTVESYLEGITDPQIAVFEQRPYHPGDLLTACIFDGARRRPPWPDSYVKLKSLSDRRNLLCNDIQHAEGQWYVSYGFGLENDADPDL
jgi:hypothetical protein